jgi:hypothetical protein
MAKNTGIERSKKNPIELGKRRVSIQSSFSFSFNDQVVNIFLKYMFYRCALKASFFTNEFVLLLTTVLPVLYRHF